METIYVMIGIIVLAIITYLIVKYVYNKSSILDLVEKPIPLNTPKIVYDSNSTKDTLLVQGGSTIMGFFNVILGDRTTKLGDNYITLLEIEGVMQFNVSQSSAQLIIATAGNVKKQEIITLPTLPMQKWMYVAILRDGRRFDIMYNDQIVASHRLEYFPVIMSNPLKVGNKSLLGNAVHVMVAGYRLKPNEVVYQRNRLSDTNGEPPVAKEITFGIPPIPFLNWTQQCLPGLPCNAVTKPPENKMKAWSSLYS